VSEHAPDLLGEVAVGDEAAGEQDPAVGSVVGDGGVGVVGRLEVVGW
jgi:hypothetical protein